MSEENLNAGERDAKEEAALRKARDLLVQKSGAETSQEQKNILPDELYQELLAIAHKSGKKIEKPENVNEIIDWFAQEKGEDFADQYDLQVVGDQFFERYIQEKVQKIEEEIKVLEGKKQKEKG